MAGRHFGFLKRAGRHEKGAGRRALQKKPRQNTVPYMFDDDDDDDMFSNDTSNRKHVRNFLIRHYKMEKNTCATGFLCWYCCHYRYLLSALVESTHGVCVLYRPYATHVQQRFIGATLCD